MRDNTSAPRVGLPWQFVTQKAINHLGAIGCPASQIQTSPSLLWSRDLRCVSGPSTDNRDQTSQLSGYFTLVEKGKGDQDHLTSSSPSCLFEHFPIKDNTDMVYWSRQCHLRTPQQHQNRFIGFYIEPVIFTGGPYNKSRLLRYTSLKSVCFCLSPHLIIPCRSQFNLILVDEYCVIKTAKTHHTDGYSFIS